MKAHTSFVLLACLPVLSVGAGVEAATVNFTYTQTDAGTGSGTITGDIDTAVVGGPGILTFTGPLPAAVVTQNDANTGFAVPGHAVGFITTADDGSPGIDNGVHIGFSGAATISATSGPDTYSIDVPLTIRQGDPYSYSFTVFDNPAENDVTGNPRFAGWPGDNGGGHRQTDGQPTFVAGQDNYTASASGALGGNAEGDNVGIAAGIRDGSFNGPVFVDDLTFGGTLQTDVGTWRVNGSPVLRPPLSSPVNVIAEHNRDGSDTPGVRGASGNTIDGSGFSGSVDVFDNPNDSHNSPPYIWYVKPSSQGAAADPPEVFYYDLGEAKTIESVVIWNQDGSGTSGQPRTQAQIGPITQVDVDWTTGTPASFSLGGMGALSWNAGITDQAVSTAMGEGQRLDFASPITTRYLRMTIDSANQGSDRQYAFNEFAVVLRLPPPPPALVNPGFEDDGTGWTQYHYTAANPGDFVTGNWYGMTAAEGNGFWADVRSYGPGDSVGDHKGVYQRVATVPGEDYSLTVALQAFSNDQSFAYSAGSASLDDNGVPGQYWANPVRIGVDPSGGIDPTADWILWSDDYDTGALWQDVSLDFTALGSAATIFLDAFPKWPIAGNWCGFDNVRLTGGPEGIIPEPATIALLGLAAAGLGGYVRRRRRA